MQKPTESASVSMVNHGGGSGVFEGSALFMSQLSSNGASHQHYRRPTAVPTPFHEPPPLSQFAPTPTGTDECSTTSASGRQPSATTPSKPTNTTSKGGTNSNENSKRSFGHSQRSDQLEENMFQNVVHRSQAKVSKKKAEYSSSATERKRLSTSSGLAEQTCFCCHPRRKSCDHECEETGHTGSSNKFYGNLSITTPKKLGRNPNGNNEDDGSSSCTSVSTHPTDEEEGNSSDSFSRNLEREIESLLSGDIGGVGSMGSSLQHNTSQGYAEQGKAVSTYVDPYKKFSSEGRTSPTLSVSDGPGTPTNEKSPPMATIRRGSEPPKPLMQPPPLSVSPHHWGSKRTTRKDESKVTIVEGPNGEAMKHKHCSHCIKRRKEESMAVAVTYRSSILSPPTSSGGKKRESVSWCTVEDPKNQNQSQNNYSQGRSFLSGSSQHGQQHERSFGRMSQDAAGGSVLANSSHSLSSGAQLSTGVDFGMAVNSSGMGVKVLPAAHNVSRSPMDPTLKNDLSHTASAMTVTPISSPSATLTESQAYLYQPRVPQLLHAPPQPYPTNYYMSNKQQQSLLEGASMAMHHSGTGHLSWLPVGSSQIAMSPHNSSPEYYSPKSDQEGDLLYIDSTRYQRNVKSSPKHYHSHSAASSSPGVLPSFMHPQQLQQQQHHFDLGSAVTNKGGSSLYGNIASMRVEESQRSIRKQQASSQQQGNFAYAQFQPPTGSNSRWDVPPNNHGPFSTDNVPIASLADVLGGNFDPNKGWHPQQNAHGGRVQFPAPLQSQLLEAGKAEILQSQQNRQLAMNPHHHYVNNPYSTNHPHRVLTPPPASHPLPVDHSQFQPYAQPQAYYNPAFDQRRQSHTSTVLTSSSPGGDASGPTPVYPRQSSQSPLNSNRSTKSRVQLRPTPKTQTPLSTKKKVVQQSQPEPEETEGPFKTLLVNFIANTVTTEEIETLFSTVGPLEGCRIIKDRKTNRSKGYAFIYYQNSEDAVRAKTILGGTDGHDSNISISDPNLKSVVDAINSNVPPPPAPGTHVVLPSAGGPGVALKGKRIKITYSTNPLNQMVTAAAEDATASAVE